MESNQTPWAALTDGPDLVFLSRDGGIRTHDLSVPNAARYQAALRPDWFTMLGVVRWDAHSVNRT